MMRFFRTVLIAAVLALPVAVFAAPTTILDNSVCDFAQGYITFDCIPRFIAHLVNFIFAGVGTFTLLQIIFGGYQIAIGGAVGTREAGINRIRMAVIGLVVTLLIYAIINFIIIGVTS